MKICLLSDLHFEFHRDGGATFMGMFKDAMPSFDVLVLAGDIATESGLYKAIEGFCGLGKPVVFVEGNHEYYGSDRGRVGNTLRKIEKRFSNFHWLHESSVTIEGQRFVGSTLWFSPSLMTRTHEGMLNDFRMIKGFRNWVYDVNERAVKYLREEVGPGDVVVTHHLPSPQASDPKWRDSALNCYFVCDLSDVIAKAQPKAWFYGHTHDSMDFLAGETRLVCNPFGYVRHDENRGFQCHKIIEV